MRAWTMSMALAAIWTLAASAHAVPRTVIVAADGSAREVGTAVGVRLASDVQEGCEGFISVEPDFELQVDTTQPSLRMRAESQAGADLVLVVQLPDGSYQCNDDTNFPDDLHPQIDIENPAVGTYRVWVGTFTSAAFTFTVSNKPAES